MNNLMLLLFLLCLVCLIIGVIKPTFVIRWGELKKRNRKSVFKYYGIGLIITFILFGVSIPKSGTSENKPKTIQKGNSSKIEKNTSSQTATVRHTKNDSLADVAYYDKTFKYVSNILVTSDIHDITSLNKALDQLSAKMKEIGDYQSSTYDSGYRCSIVKATISGKKQDIPSEPHGDLQAYTTDTYYYLKCYQCKLLGTDLPGDPQVFRNNLNKDSDMFRSELNRLSDALK